jgi:hypothetical protein
MVQSDIERIMKKSRQLGQYMTNLEKKGRTSRARRLQKERLQIDNAIADIDLH